MINVQYSPKGTPYVFASELHQMLEISTPLTIWFNRMIEYGFVENEEFSLLQTPVHTQNGGTTLKHDWAVRLDMAKHIAMIQKTPKGKEIRQYLIDMDKQVVQGALLSHVQMSALFDLCEILGYFTVQQSAESKHFKFYSENNDKKDWWKYRADVLGFSKKELEEILITLGEKYKNQRQALFKIDRYELIRVAMIDLLMAMGKPKEYAINVSKFAKKIAEKIKPEVYDDSGMSLNFKPQYQQNLIDSIGRIENNILKSF